MGSYVQGSKVRASPGLCHCVESRFVLGHLWSSLGFSFPLVALVCRTGRERPCLGHVHPEELLLPVVTDPEGWCAGTADLHVPLARSVVSSAYSWEDWPCGVHTASIECSSA